MTVFSGLVSKIGYNIEEAAARQRVFYYQVKILWYFSNWYQVNICFCQIITRWNILIFFSNLYQVNIFFFQIITRWKYFGIFLKLIPGEFVFFKLLPGENISVFFLNQYQVNLFYSNYCQVKFFWYFWKLKIDWWKTKIVKCPKNKIFEEKNETRWNEIF